RLVLASASRRQDQHPILNAQVHRRIAQREEAMPGSDSGKPWFLPHTDPAKEGLHRFVEPEVDLLQELIVDPIEFRVVLATRFERLLSGIRAKPALPVAQAHEPPIAPATTLRA